MKLTAIVCALAISGLTAIAQDQLPPPPPPDATQQNIPPDQAAPPQQMLTPDQLDDLVAPIALYPDNLLSQVLVASTYPLEVVEANQWLQQNRNLSGQELIDAARQQNWDPSVQALVAFPDVLARLNQDVQWTTELGNAFLAQQTDVMNAVQTMRERAKENGKLNSTPQESVTEQSQDGQTVIEIQPTNPQVIYVPTYNPDYVWGPPLYGYYPSLYYPAVGFGFGFGPGIYVGSFFGGCCGWGSFGWGWGPNWFGHDIWVNNYFLHRYGFHDFHGGDFHGRDVWAHNPEHRWGVPYPSAALNNRFRGGEFRGRESFGGGANFHAPAIRGGEAGNFRGNAPAVNGNVRGFGGGANSGGANAAPRVNEPRGGFGGSFSGGNHSAFGGIHNGGQTRIESDHGFSTMSPRGGFGGGGRPAGGGFHGSVGAPRGGGGGRVGGGRR
jgi:hypothetical protein